MLEDLLVHQVEVHRRSGRRDRFGQQVDVNPRQHTVGEHVATYPCRLTRGTGGLTMQERAVDTFETTFRLYTSLDVDILSEDAVRVVDGAGNELLGLSKIKNRSVASDGEGPHHLEFVIWSQGPS